MAYRIAIITVPLIAEVDLMGKAKGPYGKFAESFFHYYVKNFTFVKCVKGNYSGFFNEADENPNGMQKKFLNNETDLMFSPLDYGSGPSFLHPAAPLLAIDGVASHAPTLSVREQDMTNSLNIYTPLILSLICLSIILCGSLLLLALRRHFKVEYFFRFGHCLLNQPNFGSKILFTCKILVLFWLIAAFIIMVVYEQAINADAVSIDYSSVVESLDDLVRHEEYRPVFVQNEFIREQFKRSLDSKRQHVWNRKSTKIMEFNPMDVMNAGGLNYVHIGMRSGAIGATQFFCGMNKNRKYLIATKGFGAVDVAFYYRANLDKSQKNLIDYRSLLVGQSGIVHLMFKVIGDTIAAISPASSHACICYSKEELYDDVETLQPMQISNMSRFFGLIGLLFGLSILAFMREFTQRTEYRVWQIFLHEFERPLYAHTKVITSITNTTEKVKLFIYLFGHLFVILGWSFGIGPIYLEVC